jgi:hypothetical protein
VFGVVRAVPSLLLARVHDREQLHKVFKRVENWASPADVLAKVAVAAGAAALTVAALGS